VVTHKHIKKSSN